jgi:hypothetical protein
LHTDLASLDGPTGAVRCALGCLGVWPVTLPALRCPADRGRRYLPSLSVAVRTRTSASELIALGPAEGCPAT